MRGKTKQNVKPKAKKYRYVMAVQETVESTTAIDSDRRMTFDELKDEAERRRVGGKLSLRAVKDVDIWCEAAYDAKRPMRSVS
jgi:hypothetical protein